MPSLGDFSLATGLPCGPLAAALVLALTSACVFTPPPPLPGEEDSLSSVNGGPSGGGGSAPERSTLRDGQDSEAPGRAGDLSTRFERGQEPDVGMTLDEIQAFNKAQGDPVDGLFSLDEALVGLPAEGELWVEFVTARGIIDCRLFEDLTPVTVANFVGLARGLRPWFDSDADDWVEGQPYYDGTIFHRVIPDFMIQGGDPTATGRGNPGYVIPDEIHPQLGHDGGALSMANKGANTGSAQFFIVLEPAGHLDGDHSVFGRCTKAGVELANELANVAVGPNDKPVTDEIVQEVRVVRRPVPRA
ncbi:peptidylprolyl isomerase [Enhygromyxa salina]|uniref:peptidylprolyl isomerase n=1 Tax=Enhygromyxa salina TaxID=215803 RepID=A0A2S9YPN4_9BACT|nr:peptidylprolyl isomerase [Enhygromyxa salina]PRQ07038.1 Peptidyl-prolyl cis-trans isomerase B [Enhygromyxa salina]